MPGSAELLRHPGLDEHERTTDRGVTIDAALAVAIPDAPPPGVEVVLLSLAFAGALTWAFWWMLDHAVRLAHEGGHALVGWLVGGTVTGITLTRRPRSGGTDVELEGWLANMATALAGYSGPPMFGTAGAVLLHHGQAQAVLWISIGLIALALPMANWFGRFVAVLAGAALFPAARSTSHDTQLFVAATWSWLLLLGGLVIILQRGPAADDYARLRGLTFIPRVVWFVVFLGVSIAAVGVSALYLLGAMAPPV